ncbi:hypothetical protein LINGRAHAP2_LOCUS36391 [Linum grandiflorum]
MTRINREMVQIFFESKFFNCRLYRVPNLRATTYRSIALPQNEP